MCRATMAARSATIRPCEMPGTLSACNVPEPSSRTCRGLLQVHPPVGWAKGDSLSWPPPSTTYPISKATKHQARFPVKVDLIGSVPYPNVPYPSVSALALHWPRLRRGSELQR